MPALIPLTLAALALLTPPPFALQAAGGATQSGLVKAGRLPVERSLVTLYRASDHKQVDAEVLGSGLTDAHGAFSFSYQPPQDPEAVLYLIADGPRPDLRLATVIGRQETPEVTINELSTVATAYALAQFIDDGNIGGPAPGLPNAADILRNLVDVETGRVGQVLGKRPNGTFTRSMATFHSLGNVLAACASGLVDCSMLFAVAAPPTGPTPDDTLEAMVAIAHFPGRNPGPIFTLSDAYEVNLPALESPPTDWTLALKYVGNGHEFDGPGFIAFDSDGNAWICQNYEFMRDHSLPSCAAGIVSKLQPDGRDFPGAPYSGGGLAGAGFGIGLDPDENVWVGNFGFFGTTCRTDDLPPADSVSWFGSDGVPLAARPFTQGPLLGPQGTVSDQDGNIWIASTCNGSVVFYPADDPDSSWSFDANSELPPGAVGPGQAKPFAIAVTAQKTAWITQNRGDLAFELDATGALLNVSDGAANMTAPMGVAVDSRGNVWVSSSGIIDMPCAGNAAYGEVVDPEAPYGDLTPDLGLAGVCLLGPDGSVDPTHDLPFQGGGATTPWGIAVDGNDNVWVANFSGQHLSQFRGADPTTFPFTGAVGDPLTPASGYTNDGLVRNTGVSIDPSGNVWLTNNWLQDPVQTNPGGDGVVVFIGLAGPVKTPLIGPPQRP